jgi:hypothetical protein
MMSYKSIKNVSDIPLDRLKYLVNQFSANQDNITPEEVDELLYYKVLCMNLKEELGIHEEE